MYWHWNAPGSNFTIRGSWYINYTHIFIRYNIRGQVWAHLVTFFKCLYQSRRVRDRPFNLQGEGGLWVFFRNSELGYMTKTLIQIFFFPSPKSEYFFQQYWESEYFFRTPPPWKLNGLSISGQCVLGFQLYLCFYY